MRPSPHNIQVGGIAKWLLDAPLCLQYLPMKVEPLEMKAESEPKSRPIFTIDIPTMQCHLHGTSPHDVDRSVKLEPGPQGLLIARFGDMVHTTELSNLMLSVPPAAKTKVAKKPAAPPPAAPAPEASSPVVVAEAPLAAVAPSEPLPADAAPLPAEAAAAPAVAAKNDYSVMWYKRDRTCAIRAKFGAKGQLLSFGGKGCTKTEKEMRDFAAILVAALHAGVSVANCKKKGKNFAAP